MSLFVKRLVSNFLLSGLLAAALISLLFFADKVRFFDGAEHRLNDLMMQLRKEQVSQVPIVIVWVDDLSAMEYGFRSPTPRKLLTNLITSLSEKGVSVIALDFLLDLPHIEQDDKELSDAIVNSSVPVVLTSTYPGDDSDLAENNKKSVLQSLQTHPYIGYSEVVTGSNDIVRWIRLARSENEYGSLVSEIYHLHTGEEIPEKALSVSGMSFGLMRLNFWNTPTRMTSTKPSFQNFSAQEVPYLPAALLKDQIILIGSSIDVLGDTFLTSFSTPGNNYQLAYGVELHALALEMLFNNRLLYQADRQSIYVILWVAMMLIFLAALYMRPLFSVPVFIVVLLGWIAGSFYFFNNEGKLIAVVGPWAAMLAAFLLAQAGAIFKGQKQTRFIRSTFKQYVSPEVVDTLLKHPEELELGGQLTRVSIIFTDLEGFTSIAETLSPQEMVQRLNEYLDVMNTPIFDQRGTLDKYIGDAIMAYYGAPIGQADQADRACLTAIMMQLALQELNRSWKEDHIPPFRMRIGIHTSEVVVGNIGSQNKMEYTLIGDGVNVAARLEGINKLFGTSIVASRETVESTTEKLLTRELARIRVKGKNEPVDIFELLGVGDQTYSGVSTDTIDAYQHALQKFYQKEFDDAAALFGQLAGSGDKPSKYLQQQCLYFSANLPDNEWDGTITVGVKP